MKKLIYLALLLQFFIVVEGNAASCPTDYNYVHQIPWDSSACQSGNNDEQCCQALLSLFDVFLAQYLEDSSMFEFLDHASATTCVNEFQLQLSSMSSAVLFLAFVPGCRNDVLEFVSSPDLCDEILTKQIWTNLLVTTAIDSFCNMDLSDLTTCSLCFKGVQQVISKLVEIQKNATETTSLLCLYFVVLYLATVSKFRPKNLDTASYAFKLPLSLPKSKNTGRLILISTFVGAAVIVISLSGFLIVSMLRTRMNHNAAHKQFVNKIINLLMETLRPNTGYKNICKGDFKCPTWFSSEVQTLVLRLLDPEPWRRITVVHLIEVPWFCQVSNASRLIKMSMSASSLMPTLSSSPPRRLT